MDYYQLRMSTVISELREFVDIVESERKYAPNTATGYRVALGVFEKELNEKESEDLQEFKGHLDPIYQNVYRNNKTKFKATTLEEYKKRIKKVIQDFETYANDPSKMAAWNPARQQPSLNSKKTAQEKSEDLGVINKTQLPEIPERESGSLTRFELPLRPNMKAIILTPSDLTSREVDKILAYVNYLKSISKEENE